MFAFDHTSLDPHRFQVQAINSHGLSVVSEPSVPMMLSGARYSGGGNDHFLIPEPPPVRCQFNYNGQRIS